MGKTSYQSITEIVNQIKSKVESLNNGDLNLDELDKLTNNSRELYERLIVLRHKAFENISGNESIVEEENQDIENTIEDEKQKDFQTEVVEINEVEPIEENMMFDFSEPIEKIERVKRVEVEQIDEDENNDEAEIIKENKSESSTLNESFSSNTDSLNDAFKSKMSLADKLTNSKIGDLKSAIDINKKFAFISDLFSGSNENYNEAVNALNSCGSADKAKELLNQLSNKNHWDVENQTVEKFVDLVERRY